MRIPLFPLNAVLFPGGALPLRVFEARYMDMVTRCLREEAYFGICLIAEGKEVGQAAVPHSIGTLARIVDCDMAQQGILNIDVRGEARFRIIDRQVLDSGLQTAEVEIIKDESPLPLPESMQDLLPLMRIILGEAGSKVPTPHRLDDAVWIGNRYAELLPISALAKQKLMELEDGLLRIDTIHKYLAQKGLLTARN